MKITREHEAYALGYYDGRATGMEQNPFEPEDESRHWYRIGYDAGVSDYCALDMADEEV